LAEPAPWKAAVVRQAGTVHVGGTLAEIAACERGTWAGKASAKPFVLAAQPTLWDESRAPAGRHTLWAYCHVPHGSSLDMTAAVDAQIERFAPGFREVVLARATVNAVEMEAYNPNYVGGDIASGVQDWRQLWTRPTVQWNPYRTALPGLYLCSAATPPGGGVHGMCGYNAARTVLKDLGLREPVLQQYQPAG
jgi:phytoene dehydrogenase-like protein